MFVISDLHLGGEPGGRSSRGFRMCTELDRLRDLIDTLANSDGVVEIVINGDFVDFLAEKHDGQFYAFSGSGRAVKVLERLTNVALRPQEAAVFASLRAFLRKNNARPGSKLLTILYGNHDIELLLPAVREHLRRYLTSEVLDETTYQFLEDGKYVLPNAFITHGNQTDPFNLFFPQELDRLRSWSDDDEQDFESFVGNPGSRLVTTVMNQVKARYPFVDLLKPELKAMIPVLLALAPEYAGALGKVAQLYYDASRRKESAVKKDVVLINHSPAEDRQEQQLSQQAALARALEELGIGPSGVELMATLRSDAPSDVRPIADGPESFAISPTRLHLLRVALRAFRRDLTMPPNLERNSDLRDLLGRVESEYVVLGHSHVKQEPDGGIQKYFNSGTWADLVEFPVEVLSDSSPVSALGDFVESLRELRNISCPRSFIRLELDHAGLVTSATLGQHGAP